MTEGVNGLNRRKALDIRTGWLVEAHMALICGKVITWFIGSYSLNSEGFEMTMTKVPVLAIAAGLLLAISGPSFAAKRMSDTKSAVKSQSRAAESSGSANSGSAIRPYSRDPYPYGRDDPYAPGGELAR